MQSIFSKLISGELPCNKVAESNEFLAFLDIKPNVLGHTLCIPKKTEDKIFVLKESIRSLKIEFGDVMLEYNFLSSPGKLTEYQDQCFEKDLMKIDTTKIKEITESNNLILINNLVKNKNE